MMSSKTLNAAERVRAAAAERAAQRAASEGRQRELEARQGHAQAAHDAAVAKTRRARERREQDLEDAKTVVDSKLQDIARCGRNADRRLELFTGAHPRFRDVAVERLERSLAAVPAQIDVAREIVLSKLLGPHEAAGAPELAALLAVERLGSEEGAAALRRLIEGAAYSPLSSAEYAELQRRAKQYQEAIAAAELEAESARDTISAARNVGMPTDADVSAAQLASAKSLDLIDVAKQAEENHRRVLDGEPTTTTRGPQ